MTRDELKQALTDRGIEFNVRWKTEKLQEILDESTGTEMTNVGVTIKEPEIIPQKDNGWAYVIMEISEGQADIVRKRFVNGIMHNASNEFVRSYTLEDHGEGYLDLAKMFVAKNNR